MRDIKSIFIGALAIVSFACVGVRALESNVSTNNINTPKQVTHETKATPIQNEKQVVRESPKKIEQQQDKTEAQENSQCSYCKNHVKAYDYGYNLASESYDSLSRQELMALADDMGVGTCHSCRDKCRAGINDYCNTRDKLEAEKTKIDNEKKVCSVCHHPYSDYGCSDDICFSPEAKGMN